MKPVETRQVIDSLKRLKKLFYEGAFSELASEHINAIENSIKNSEKLIVEYDKKLERVNSLERENVDLTKQKADLKDHNKALTDANREYLKIVKAAARVLRKYVPENALRSDADRKLYKKILDEASRY